MRESRDGEEEKERKEKLDNRRSVYVDDLEPASGKEKKRQGSNVASRGWIVIGGRK